MACVSINDCDVKSHVVRFDEACLNILCLVLLYYKMRDF
jgi:hypothetical protein